MPLKFCIPTAAAVVAAILCGCVEPAHQNVPVRIVTGSPAPISGGARQPMAQSSRPRPVQSQPVDVKGGSEVGSEFKQKLAKARQADRERRIGDFLWRNPMPGVEAARVRLKGDLTEVDDNLRTLELDIRRAGRDPSRDASYSAIVRKRNGIQSRLDAIDRKILDAIANRSATAAAGSITFTPAERAELEAAIANLDASSARFSGERDAAIGAAGW